jgi:DNA-binding CsgD family transcriptional regulator
VTSEQRDDILSELRKIGRLLTLLVTKDLGQKEKIELLSTAGLQPKEIAELIGTTPNTVSVRLAHIRKQQAGRRAGRAAKRDEIN